MDNPYSPPRSAETALTPKKSPRRWLARGFAALLFGAALITLYVSIAVIWTDYFMNEEPGTQISATLTLVSCAAAWGPASFFFWSGTQTRRRWLLVAFPAIVLVVAAMVTVLVYGAPTNS